MIRIEQWAIIRNGDQWTAPELITASLTGYVYGHPRHADGTFVHSSAISEIKDGVCKTQNTVYELGCPSPEYAKAYPQVFDVTRCIASSKLRKKP